MVRGPFRHLSHDHVFEPVGDGTRMIDRFEVSSRIAWFDRLVLVPHLRRFLERRNDFVRRLAESGDWQRYLD
jgi:ligand-binding SRPBCC domain-containing protein